MGVGTAIRSVLRGRTQNEIELEYLEQSVSRTDLERRQREIAAGKLRPRRLNF